ncbi:hypothetical protein BC830DRAFT_1224959 [Chytriomyces sp. MP71]|nr:hypothetical protein BC830DRAFT_1224959 [Chytriomyces sp. MP71]
MSDASAQSGPTPNRASQSLLNAATGDGEGAAARMSTTKAAAFAVAPHAVTTTVVTTTTTRITEFPSLLIDPTSNPASGPSLDSSRFPLANTPTPPALKKFCFDLNGVPTRFTELDLTEDDLKKLNQPVSHAKSEKTIISTLASPSAAQQHLQQHALHASALNTTQERSALGGKGTRKRDRTSAFEPAATLQPFHSQLGHIQAIDAVMNDGTVSVPLTPFPDITAQQTAVAPLVSVTLPNAPYSPIQPTLTSSDDLPNLPSPTMSPMHTSPPHVFHAPTNRPATSPSPRTISRALTASPRDATSPTNSTTCPHQEPNLAPLLSDIPTILHTYTHLPPQLQRYLLLHLLRRTPLSALQFVSNLVLPALKSDFLGALPAELAYQILAHVDLRALARAARVCKRWHSVVQGEGAGIAVWKRRLVADGWWEEGEVKGVLEKWILWRRAKSLRRRREKGKDVLAKEKEGEDVEMREMETAREEERGMGGRGRKNVVMKASGDSLNSGTTVVVEPGAGMPKDVGFGLQPGSFGNLEGDGLNVRTHSASQLHSQDDDDESIVYSDDYYDSDSEREHHHSDRPYYEFEEDEEEDDFDDDPFVTTGPGEFEEYVFPPASDAEAEALRKSTAEWMKTIEEFSSGYQSSASSSVSLFGLSKGHKPSAVRRRISRVRARLRAYIETLSKSELSSRALQVPNLYKEIYRRHHIVRRNWVKGNHKTIAFPGHETHVVTCLQFDSDKIVSGSDDQTIHIYDTNTGRLRKKLVGHDGGVWALQYWGDALVSGSTDRTVRVWDMDTGLCTHLFEGHTSTVRCLMIVPPTPSKSPSFRSSNLAEPILEPAEPLIVTGSRDATLRVWRLPNPKADKSHIPHNAAGTVNVSSAGNTYDDAGTNPWFVHTLTGHTNSVRAIAGHGRVLVSGSYDATVRVWDLVSGECVHTLRGHREKVYSVGYSHELGRAVSGSLDATVKVWCTRTGVLLHNLEGHSSLVGLLELSPEYLVSAAADQSLRIWAPTTGHCLAHLYGHSAAITCLHHDPRLNRIVSGSDGSVKLWELSSASGGGLDGSAIGTGPGFEFRQGPNGPEPVYGRFTRDLISNIQGVWRVRMDERRLVCAISREGGSTWFEVLDFGEAAEYGMRVEGPGDGGPEWMDGVEEDDDGEDHGGGEDGHLHLPPPQGGNLESNGYLPDVAEHGNGGGNGSTNGNGGSGPGLASILPLPAPGSLFTSGNGPNASARSRIRTQLSRHLPPDTMNRAELLAAFGEGSLTLRPTLHRRGSDSVLVDGGGSSSSTGAGASGTWPPPPPVIAPTGCLTRSQASTLSLSAPTAGGGSSSQTTVGPVLRAVGGAREAEEHEDARE